MHGADDEAATYLVQVAPKERAVMRAEQRRRREFILVELALLPRYLNRVDPG